MACGCSAIAFMYDGGDSWSENCLTDALGLYSDRDLVVAGERFGLVME